ncbi:hypothetical protein B0J12DRAFT_190889 [Macrophomina phaseolina]|uniref:Uncharacterized protein n=1 Tax=Macrophomina phaseolina TaxID=35725 RepID=A0ABQ8G3E9_9PEZI|nr:hypothetical protein B0J12DRAFT_190889 [Macrophomina phaseolina]
MTPVRTWRSSAWAAPCRGHARRSCAFLRIALGGESRRAGVTAAAAATGGSPGGQEAAAWPGMAWHGGGVEVGMGPSAGQEGGCKSWRRARLRTARTWEHGGRITRQGETCQRQLKMTILVRKRARAADLVSKGQLRSPTAARGGMAVEGERKRDGKVLWHLQAES